MKEFEYVAVCVDKNECEESGEESLCDTYHGVCNNMEGGATCSCLLGYQLHSDGVDCMGECIAYC